MSWVHACALTTLYFFSHNYLHLHLLRPFIGMTKASLGACMCTYNLILLYPLPHPLAFHSDVAAEHLEMASINVHAKQNCDLLQQGLCSGHLPCQHSPSRSPVFGCKNRKEEDCLCGCMLSGWRLICPCWRAPRMCLLEGLRRCQRRLSWLCLKRPSLT